MSLGFSLLEDSGLPIPSHSSFLDRSTFLFLRGSVLAGCPFLGIYPFPPGRPTRIILCIYFAIIIVSSLFTLEHLKIVGSNSFHK